MNWPILILGGYLVLTAWDLVTGSNQSRDSIGNHDDSSQSNSQADDEAIVYFFDQQTSDNDS